MRSATLRQRILSWLVVYALLLSATVAITGYLVHEHAEHTVWEALLESELDSIVERSREDPGYRWQNSDTLRLYRLDVRAPASLRALTPGLHDDIALAQRQNVVLVRDAGELGRLALALDVTDFEGLERFVLRWALLAALGILLVTAGMAWFGMGRVVRPLTGFAQRIGALRPEVSGQRVATDAHASAELVVIAEALNGYLQRNEQFVERERVFIDSASHELRTPISVIAGAAELALEQAGVPPVAREQLQRVQRTVHNIEQLISLLLALARDPSRLAAASDRVALDQLLPEIIDDHRHLARGKDLTLTLLPSPACSVVAPLPIVQAAIGNLLRNAIEHSDSGEIRVRLDADATVTIEDPGHGMSPEEISAIYSRMARGSRDGGGIGLDLIARLCEHFGWTLRFDSDVDRGTVTTLRLGGAR